MESKSVGLHFTSYVPQLNYIPAPATIFKNVKKLMPGHYLKVRNKAMEVSAYYQIHSTKPSHCFTL